MNKISLFTATLMLTPASVPAAFAQQSNMRGMGMQDHMGGMDMQSMMNQCARIRQRMQAGARMSSDMQNVMSRCDHMDRQMGNMSGGAAPRAHTR